MTHAADPVFNGFLGVFVSSLGFCTPASTSFSKFNIAIVPSHSFALQIFFATLLLLHND